MHIVQMTHNCQMMLYPQHNFKQPVDSSVKFNKSRKTFKFVFSQQTQYKWLSPRTSNNVYGLGQRVSLDREIPGLSPSKPSTNDGDTFLESDAFGESALDELNIAWD
jgi:hypothetical protein